MLAGRERGVEGKMNDPEVDLQTLIGAVQRTARNGVALGIDRFCNATGFKQTDWNRLGLRWGEVVRLAGFSENRFSPQAQEPKEISTRLAALTRKLGRIPARVDITRTRREDPTFPYARALGRRQHRRRVLMEMMSFCRREGGWDDVIAITEQYLERLRDRPSARFPRSETVDQYENVYLMKFGQYYKIGRSNSAGRREYELQTKLPGKVRTIHAIRTNDPVGIEAYWHKRFADKRVNGEWFRLSPEDVSEFKRREFM
jgi:hypothetical protein